MSAFGKKGVRCDTCGKIANNWQGEYTRKNGTCGYIWPANEDNPGREDICEECSVAAESILLGSSEKAETLNRNSSSITKRSLPASLGAPIQTDALTVEENEKPTAPTWAAQKSPLQA